MNEVEFTFYNVEHGNATHIKCPNGKYIVVDLGASKGTLLTGGYSPLEQLINQGVDCINYLVITHPHKDHIDDILKIDEIPPHVMWRPTVSHDDLLKNILDDDFPLFERYIKLDNGYKVPVSEDNPNNPLNAANYGNLSIKRYVANISDSPNINNLSCINVFEFEGLKIVITGDNEEASLLDLMKQSEFVENIKDSDILLAPHHGRASGFCSEFVKTVNPRLTIVSDGRQVETSVTQSYSQLSRGWGIYKNNIEEQRKVLTTRNDGTIKVKIGMGDTKKYLNVQAGF